MSSAPSPPPPPPNKNGTPIPIGSPGNVGGTTATAAAAAAGGDASTSSASTTTPPSAAAGAAGVAGGTEQQTYAVLGISIDAKGNMQLEIRERVGVANPQAGTAQANGNGGQTGVNDKIHPIIMTTGGSSSGGTTSSQSASSQIERVAHEISVLRKIAAGDCSPSNNNPSHSSNSSSSGGGAAHISDPGPPRIKVYSSARVRSTAATQTTFPYPGPEPAAPGIQIHPASGFDPGAWVAQTFRRHKNRDVHIVHSLPPQYGNRMPSSATPAPATATSNLAPTTPSNNAAAAAGTPALPPSEPAPTVPPPPVTVLALEPPNWKQCSEEALASPSNYKTFPVDPTSLEYQTISNMLRPTQLLSVEKIVNPELWRQYSNKRKDMLRSKSNDLDFLRKLGLDEQELQRCSHLSRDFEPHPNLKTESGLYSPNEVLLFHCTRKEDNLQKILSQGLDERLGSATGSLLGKGIYFADDPQKSIKYDGGSKVILVVAVLLGDCLDVTLMPNRKSFVREPEKEEPQRRNFGDMFFDSITARPAGSNEFVIYNRYQCCPLYLVNYEKGGGSVQSSSDIATDDYVEYTLARYKSPSVAWRKLGDASSAVPNPALDGSWPFYAANLFKKMGVLPPPDEPPPPTSVAGKPKPSTSTSRSRASSPPAPILPLFENGKILAFVDLVSDGEDGDAADDDDEDKMGVAAKKPKLTVEEVQPECGSPAPAPPPSPAPPSIPLKEDCLICYSEYDADPTLWKVLQCGHTLCLVCYTRIETTGSTMSGDICVSVKCPFCQGITGIPVGICPDGKMTFGKIQQDCEGYPGSGTIKIIYVIDSGPHPIRRFAYLPNTPEGQEILNLLSTAWQRRWIFTVGTSATTGRENAVVWNIHHKTALEGGVQKYGYPDPTYFQRVREELKAYQIE